MTNANYLPLASAAATLFGAMVTRLVMKRHFASKKLSYSYAIEPIIRSNDPDLEGT